MTRLRAYFRALPVGSAVLLWVVIAAAGWLGVCAIVAWAVGL